MPDCAFGAGGTCISVEYRSSFEANVDGKNAGGGDGLPLCSVRVAMAPAVKSDQGSNEPFFLSEIRSAITQHHHHSMAFCFVLPTLACVSVTDEQRIGWPEIATPDRRIFLCSPQESSRYFVANEGSALGFITADDNADACAVRLLIQSMLSRGTSFRMRHFRLPNGYALNVPDEPKVRLFDICSTSRRILIATEDMGENATKCETAPTGIGDSYGSSTGGPGGQFVLRKAPSPRQRRSASSPPERRIVFPGLDMDKRLSFNTSKNLPRLQSPMMANTPGKKFLISYVQKEGREKAILLKTELELHGCSVFLDFENIAAGMDWQDILNNAVKVCEVFVPLVTDSYGETLWTNREVKLADVMKKVVVPVSLIDSWPPSCLAIQFCTTQHVRWKSQHDNSAPGCTPPEADKESVRNVAREILQLYRQVKAQNIPICMTAADVETPPFDFRSTARRRRSTVKSYPYEAGSSDDLQEAKKAREGRPLIVICAHKSQMTFVESMRESIASLNFDIWSTTDAPALWPEPALRESAVTPLFDTTNRVPQRISFMSNNSGDTVSTVSPAESIDGCLFQEKADEAAIVVLLLSKAFASSSICKHFLFYVERRKRFIPLICDDFPMPGWMTTLIGNKDVDDVHVENFPDKLRQKLNRAVRLDNHAEITDEDLSEVNVLRGMEFLRKSDIPHERTVYISGSGTQGMSTASLSIEIAKELASLPGLCIATGGCRGVGETLSSHFVEYRKNNWTARGKMPECVYHILPTRDDQNQEDVASQNADGSFNPATTGKSFFFGKSLRERETVVGRYFKVCVLIDGDTHAAHEATESMWADNIVLPVCKSGGAAGGEFDFRMEKPPPGVSEVHWSVLRSKDSSDSEVAVAIRQILEALLPEISSKENIKKTRTPRVAKPKKQPCPVTPSSPYALRERTGKKRMFYTDESAISEEESASKYLHY